MTENVENLILEHLRALRSDVGIIKADLRDLKIRMSSMENYMASFHLEIARHSAKFDDVDARIERIERRLELGDTP
jgi:archaellum component FlaC